MFWVALGNTSSTEPSSSLTTFPNSEMVLNAAHLPHLEIRGKPPQHWKSSGLVQFVRLNWQYMEFYVNFLIGCLYSAFKYVLQICIVFLSTLFVYSNTSIHTQRLSNTACEIGKICAGAMGTKFPLLVADRWLQITSVSCLPSMNQSLPCKFCPPLSWYFCTMAASTGTSGCTQRKCHSVTSYTLLKDQLQNTNSFEGELLTKSSFPSSSCAFRPVSRCVYWPSTWEGASRPFRTSSLFAGNRAELAWPWYPSPRTASQTQTRKGWTRWPTIFFQAESLWVRIGEILFDSGERRSITSIMKSSKRENQLGVISLSNLNPKNKMY